MKQIVFVGMVALCAHVLALTVRERAEGLLQRFNGGVVGEVVTNGEDCVLITVDDSGEYRFCYSRQAKTLGKVLQKRPDGSVDGFEYRQGKVVSALYASADAKAARSFVFVGDGKETNSVDYMEFEFLEGKPKGRVRLYDVMGRLVDRPPPKKRSWWEPDVECIPMPGLRTQIGPYDWIVVDESRRTVLSRNGTNVLTSDCRIGGEYPWIVGIGQESARDADRPELTDKGISACSEYGSVVYYFVIDVRDDHVEYISDEKGPDEIERITGRELQAYKLGSFWDYVLSKRSKERLNGLEKALQPPAIK